MLLITHTPVLTLFSQIVAEPTNDPIEYLFFLLSPSLLNIPRIDLSTNPKKKRDKREIFPKSHFTEY